MGELMAEVTSRGCLSRQRFLAVYGGMGSGAIESSPEMAGVEGRSVEIRWYIVAGLDELHRSAALEMDRGCLPGGTGCYIFPSFKEIEFEPSVDYSTENSEEPR